MPTGIKAKDAMVTKVVTAIPSQSVLEISKIMKDQDVGSVVVIENGKPVGIVTREDIVNKVVAENKSNFLMIKEIMTGNLVTCSPDCDISEVAMLMAKHGYERIPIISMDNLVGIISAREIAKVAPAVIEILTENIRIQEPQSFENEEHEGECELCGNYSDKLNKLDDKWVCDTCKGEAEL
jgi:CBS domain-containing protein